MDKPENWTCSCCGKDITYFEEGEPKPDCHFDIIRSRKQLLIEDDEIVEDESVEKMHMQICECCFLKILNESETLGKLFYDSKSKRFLY